METHKRLVISVETNGGESGYVCFDENSGGMSYLSKTPFNGGFHDESQGSSYYKHLVTMCNSPQFSKMSDGSLALPSDIRGLAGICNDNKESTLTVTLVRVMVTGPSFLYVKLGHMIADVKETDIVTSIKIVECQGLWSELNEVKDEDVQLTPDEYGKFVSSISSNPAQRIGQLFCNSMDVSEAIRKELFNLDGDVAMSYIVKHCVNWS